jgi:plasmid stabilization system protein ParE
LKVVFERSSTESAGRPLSAPRVEQRPGLHVAAVICYPFKIFYRVFDDHIRIVHIRHTARRPWSGGE